MSSQAAATTSSSASVQKTIIHQKMHPKLLTGKEKEHRHKRFEQDDSATEQDDDDENSTDDECVAENNDEMSPQELVSLRRKMMTLPLAKLSQLKAKLGVALFNKTLDAVENEKNVNAGQTAVIGKKSNSKRPREESSTRPPPKLRPIPGLQPKKAKNARFDPRFSTDCGGQFDEVAFHRDYAFLDDFRQHDMQELQKAYRQAKKEKRIGQAERIKCNLQRLKNQQKASREQKLMQQIRAELRQTNIERMNGGQAPIYLNNNELKERFLERKTQLHGKGSVKEKGQPKISGRSNEEKEDAQKPFDEDGMGNKSNDH